MQKMYWIYALTPLHVGAGSGVEFVDLPIMREKSTGWPIVPPSVVKGVWKDYWNNKADGPLLQAAFGKDTTGPDDFASAIVITDARIVLLPIRSFYGTFAYVTAPLALQRLKRDWETTGIVLPPVPQPGESEVLVQTGKLQHGGKLYLEELDFAVKENPATAQWAEKFAKTIFDNDWQQIFKDRFAIVPDTTFDFFCQMGTEVNTRIRIDDDKKVVQEGALWQEESLPAESVLAGLVWCERNYSGSRYTETDMMNQFCKGKIRCQLGGKATVGKGQVICRFSEQEGGRP